MDGTPYQKDKYYSLMRHRAQFLLTKNTGEVPDYTAETDEQGNF
jgi:hypothetical protein